MRHESLVTYLPTDRRHSLATGFPLPVYVRGSALFADISGFTPLTEALARTLGARQGAEELTRQLNRVYDALIDEVDRYGGSIIGFSGDAITCWFDSRPLEEALLDCTPEEDAAGIAAAALRATTCALALQRAMAAFTDVPLPNGGTTALSLKTAIASGPAARFLVGDPDIQVLEVLAGETLNRMAAAEHCANKGENVIDAATAALLLEGDNLQIAEWREGGQFAVVRGLNQPAPPSPWSALLPDDLPTEYIRAWIVKALHERPDETLTELRPAAALFLRFLGIDYDFDPDAATKFDAFMRWVQSVTERYGGTLIQLTTGDKGSYLYVAFGAPIAYENNAERAASAALELRALPPDLNFIQPVQIGISQGIMRTGAYGGQTRRTYGVLGDDVNLAARLMQYAAPGEILVSQRIGKAIGGSFSLEEMAPIRLKGKSEPMPVARLNGKVDLKRQTRIYQRPLVGRAAELEQLVTLLKPVPERQPIGCVYVCGEPGIGKSHLIGQAQLRLTAGEPILWYSCATDQMLPQPLHPFIPLLARFFDQELGEDDDDRRALFDSAMDALLRRLWSEVSDTATAIADALDESRSFLGALLGLRWPGSPYEILEPRLRFERSLAAINTLLHAESVCQPLLLHIQDAHWLDPESQTLVRLLAETARHSPLALLIDGRSPDEDSSAEAAVRQLVGDDVPLQIMKLGQLASEGVRELAALTLGGPISDRLHRFLLQKANGNPFFTEQLALDLSERGLLIQNTEQASGSWDIDAELDELPATINAVLIARLDRLVSQVRTIVQIASVLGHEFEVPVLARMVSDEPDVRERVRQAEAETIWMRMQNDRDYLFRHALLRDAAYNMQLQERLRALHAQAGNAIEQVYADNLAEKAADLAYHYEKSGLLDRAVIYLIRAAQHMMGIHANREALEYYRRAMALADRSGLSAPAIAPIYDGAGDISEMLGEYGQAVAHYEQALGLLDAEHPLWRAKLLHKKGQVLQKWGQYLEATACYEQALVELQADLNADEACQIYAGLSMINYRQGKLDDALELAMLALLMAGDDPRNLAQAHQNLGILHWKRSDFEQALESDRQSLGLWESLQNANGCAAVHNNLGLLHQDMGDPGLAVSHFEQSLTLFERVGNQHGLACVYDNLGRTYMEKGEQERAIECLEKAVSILAKIGLDETQVFSSMWQSGTW